MIIGLNVALNFLGSGYNNLTNWPSAANRPVFNSGTNTLSWIGPTGGGASTASDTAQSQVLTNSGAVSSSADNQVIQNLNITGGSSSGLLTITHNNVTVKRCRIRNASGAGFGPVVSWSGTGGVIEDCLVDGASTQNPVENSQNGVDPFSATGLVMRRLNCQNLENHIRSAFSGTVIDCWLHAAAGADADMVELDCNNNSAAINGWTIRHNTGDGGDSHAGVFLDSFTNPDNFNHSAGGAAVQNVTIDNNAMINFASAAGNFVCIIADAGQAGWNGTVDIFATNNGFFNMNGSANIERGATASVNSGNFNMATVTATSGTPVNGTGQI
jgi:hypothetical protein